MLSLIYDKDFFYDIKEHLKSLKDNEKDTETKYHKTLETLIKLLDKYK
jgi:hypothetical protein